MQFNSSNFYLSVTEDLLMAAITLTKNYYPITDENTGIIMQAQKPILCHGGSLWTKKRQP